MLNVHIKANHFFLFYLKYSTTDINDRVENNPWQSGSLRYSNTDPVEDKKTLIMAFENLKITIF